MLCEHVRQHRVADHRQDEHRQREVLLERPGQHEVDEESRRFRGIRGREDADVLDLTETRRLDDTGRCDIGRDVGEEDLRRRTRCVTDDQGPVAATCVREGAVVGVGPAVRHQHIVRAQALPELERTFFAEDLDAREQERETRRGRRCVLDRKESGVARVGEVGEGRRDVECAGLEPCDVIVDAHVTEVDGRHAIIGRLQARVHAVESG